MHSANLKKIVLNNRLVLEGPLGWLYDPQWEGQDGTCEICGELVSNHRDWVLPDRVVKVCNGKLN